MDSNYAVAPGEYLQEWLDENETTQQQAADLLGCSRKLVNEIVNGRAPVTPDTATRLQQGHGHLCRLVAHVRGGLSRGASPSP